MTAQLSALEWLVTVESPPQAVPWPTLDFDALLFRGSVARGAVLLA
ncbi:hypothetical protein [Cystobacter ferrugineus]|nr:hypothetical protein [Cystobacter ferrugineus]